MTQPVSKQVLGEFSRVRLFVPGRARTKGSLKPDHIRTGAGKCVVRLRESGEYSVAWKKIMISVIRGTCECTRYEGAVRVDSTFLFAPESQVDVDEIAAGVLPWPTKDVYGDRDKLERNVLDALTQSGLIKDDRYVVDGIPLKRWVRPGEQAGVWIEVKPA